MSDNPGFVQRMGTYFGEVRTELTKVTWPSKEQVKNYTIIVIVSVAILSVLIGFWDLALTYLMQFIFNF